MLVESNSTGCEKVRQEVSKYSGWDVNIMTAISEAESTQFGIPCYVNATGDKNLVYQQNGRDYGYSVSVLQVRILPGREHCDAYDIAVNVGCAYQIWKSQGYEAWTQYLNNQYKEFL